MELKILTDEEIRDAVNKSGEVFANDRRIAQAQLEKDKAQIKAEKNDNKELKGLLEGITKDNYPSCDFCKHAHDCGDDNRVICANLVDMLVSLIQTLIEQEKEKAAREIFDELESNFENWVVHASGIKEAQMCFERQNWEALKSKYGGVQR